MCPAAQRNSTVAVYVVQAQPTQHPTVKRTINYDDAHTGYDFLYEDSRVVRVLLCMHLATSSILLNKVGTAE